MTAGATTSPPANHQRMSDLTVVEHRDSSLGRRLRRRRLQAALAIAALEGILVVAGALPWWVALLLAVAGVGAYAGFGRDHARADVRDVSWIAAVSQLIVLIVPLAIVVIGVLALVAVTALAAVALTVLLLDRR